MKFPVFGIVRRAMRSRDGAKAAADAPIGLIEPLEPRLLLSGATLGALPNLSESVGSGGDTYRFNMPDVVKELSSPSVSGSVFNDVDGDGYRDPSERALAGVTLFADIDGDGLLGDGEASAQTNQNGYFSMSGLQAGSYDVRVVMPDDYKAATDGSGAASVTISPVSGVGGLSFGLSPKGFDLGLIFSDVSMPDSFKTGTRVKVPVIVTNRGDTAMTRGDIRLRVWTSEDKAVSKDDIRLLVKPFKRGLAPGESVKIELNVKLPDALADFHSHLIVDAVGRRLSVDLNLGDNKVVSPEVKTFVASNNPTFVGMHDLNIILGNWSTTTPYGGYEPGDGFVGLYDLDVVLGNWNQGTRPGGTTTIINDWNYPDPIGPVDPPPPPTLPNDSPGEPGSITGAVVHDPHNAMEGNLGWLWPGVEGLEGWTVFLDQDQDGFKDDGEQWALTAADGSFSFTDLPTHWAGSQTPKVYHVRVEVPDGWQRHYGADSYSRPVHDGDDLIDFNFAYYAPPQIGTVEVQGGYLLQNMSTVITAQDVLDPDGTVSGVAFYYDHDGDQTVDDLLGVDRDGSDGYSIVYDGSHRQELGHSVEVIAVVQDSDGHMRVSSTYAAARLAVEVTSGKQLRYHKANGSVISVSMKGPGSATVRFKGTGIRAWDLGNVIEITGDTGVEEVQLVKTSGRSKLSIQATGGAKKTQFAGKITGATPLGALSARNIKLTGGINMTGRGVIHSIEAAMIDGLTMTNDRYEKGIAIKADVVTGNITLGSRINQIDAGRIARATITAPSAHQILVKKNLTSSTLKFTDTAAGLSLSLLKVGKTIEGVYLQSASSIDTVQAKSILRSAMLAGTTLQGQSVASHSVGFNQRAAIQNLIVSGGTFANSYVAAWRLGTVKLDAVLHDDPNSLFGVVYKKLGRYTGPGDLNNPANPTLSKFEPVFVPLFAPYIPLQD